MAGSEVKYVPLALGNVADGELEAQFAVAKHRLLEEFQKAHDGLYAPNSEGQIKGVVKIEVELTLNVQTQALFVSGRVTGIKLPAMPKWRGAAYFSGDDIHVEAARQERLPLEGSK